MTSWQALIESARALIIPALIFAAIAFGVRGVESLRTARAASPEVRTNLALFTFDIIAITPLLTLLLGFTSTLIQHNGFYFIAADQWRDIPLPIIALAAIFIGDFVGYWRHRLEHTALLWPGHAIHHSDTAMTWTTGVRFHPLNRLTTTLIDSTTLALIGFPPEPS